MSKLREDFDVWYRAMFAENPNRPGALTEWLAYQAATERAAKIVEEVGPKGALTIVTEGFAAAIRGGDGGGR